MKFIKIWCKGIKCMCMNAASRGQCMLWPWRRLSVAKLGGFGGLLVRKGCSIIVFASGLSISPIFFASSGKAYHWSEDSLGPPWNFVA